MQFRLLPAFLLFLGSYFPLSLILLVQDIPDGLWKSGWCLGLGQDRNCTFQILAHPALALLSVASCSIALMIASFAFSNLTLRFSVTVEELKSVPNDLINYAFPYIVSFMGLGYDSPSKLAGFLVFFALMFAITYKSGQIAMNPLLILFGWRLYEVRLDVGGSKRVTRALKKGALTPGPQRMEVVQDFVFLGDS